MNLLSASVSPHVHKQGSFISVALLVCLIFASHANGQAQLPNLGSQFRCALQHLLQ
jgi:hypothetical protein